VNSDLVYAIHYSLFTMHSMSLTFRLTLTYLLLTLCGLLLLGGGLLALTGRYLAQRSEAELQVQAEVVAGLLGELAITSNELQSLASEDLLQRVIPAGSSVRLFTTAGAFISGATDLGPFPSRPALALLSNPLPLPASQATGRRYVAYPIGNTARPLAILELSRSSVDEQTLLTTLRNTTLQAAMVAALVMAIASYLVARSISRPVLRLATRAQTLAHNLHVTTDDRRPTAYTRRGTTSRPSSVGGRRSSQNELATLTHALDQLEAQLQNYTARIEELQQARVRLLRNVSHELRTPLTAISGTAENLRDRVPPQHQAALGTIESEAQRLARLVDALLNPPADGLLPVERQPIDLAVLVDELCASQQNRARRAGVTLTYGAEVSNLPIRGDRDRLKQAILNLLDNALRATPPGGTIVISLAASPDWAELRLRDSGPGVPSTLRERIWERGVSGSEGGAGLGLAIVREIIAAHGGQALLSEHTPGAEFVLRLPLL
jgi:signal transduction histidine kinase